MPNSSQKANQSTSKKVRYMRLASDAHSWQLANMKLRIKEIRKKQGMTAETLAAKAGCSKSYMSEIETGKKFPSGRLMSKIANELGVSLFEIIDSDDISQEILMHIEIMQSLSEEDRRSVSRHAASLLEKAT
uniref:helix-turn-helix transcriptional regulator n=1 Tax=Roseovarius sp. BRH_c41 TaxID=1629709 RepID=UPI0025F18C4D|nr:helix-turn-helix transcriptional regulator [Roseovarius sp. BRH_c41]